MLPKGTSGFNVLFKEYRKDAKRRGLVFSLTFYQFVTLITSKCFYCGEIPRKTRKDLNYTYYPPANGIDRADNMQGYIFFNCLPCCVNCNRFKRTLTITNFLAVVGKIYEKHTAYFKVQKKAKNKRSRLGNKY